RSSGQSRVPVPHNERDRQKEWQVQSILYFDWPSNRSIQDEFEAEHQPQAPKDPKSQRDPHRLHRFGRISSRWRRLLYDIDIRDLSRKESLIELCLLQSRLGIPVIGFQQLFLSLQLCNLG